jgi:hypothetical protein
VAAWVAHAPNREENASRAGSADHGAAALPPHGATGRMFRDATASAWARRRRDVRSRRPATAPRDPAVLPVRPGRGSATDRPRQDVVRAGQARAMADRKVRADRTHPAMSMADRRDRVPDTGGRRVGHPTAIAPQTRVLVVARPPCQGSASLVRSATRPDAAHGSTGRAVDVSDRCPSRGRSTTRSSRPPVHACVDPAPEQSDR